MDILLQTLNSKIFVTNTYWIVTFSSYTLTFGFFLPTPIAPTPSVLSLSLSQSLSLLSLFLVTT